MRHGWLVWGALAVVIAVPLIAALASPQLAWRGPVYTVAGFAGVVGLALYVWRRAHSILAVVIVVVIVVHAVLILGTMEPVSKYILCALVVIATGKVIYDRRAWVRRAR